MPKHLHDDCPNCGPAVQVPYGEACSDCGWTNPHYKHVGEQLRYERLLRRDREYTCLVKELREKGLIYTTCAGCGWAYSDQPEVVLDAVKGRDCGCPAGTGFAVREVSRKRTPEEIAEWAYEQRKQKSGSDRSREAHGYVAAMEDLCAFLDTRHAKKYKCSTCHDEKVLHDTPTPGIETPCPDCT